MVSAAGTSEVNRLEHLVNDDLDPKWNDPTTRSDLRLLAIRIDAKFDGLESRFDKIDARFDMIDAKFAALEPRFDQMRVDLEHAMFRGGRMLFGATATVNLGMLAIFATFIK